MKPFSTDASRWTALQARDPAAEGHFVYCVKTTNIYCRPTCKARLARRVNVKFHTTAAAAQADGFRACKRCKPDLARHDPQADVVARACRTLEMGEQAGNERPVSLKVLAKEAGLTEAHFHRLFKSLVGVTPRMYALGIRDQVHAEAQAQAQAQAQNRSGSHSQSQSQNQNQSPNWKWNQNHNQSYMSISSPSTLSDDLSPTLSSPSSTDSVSISASDYTLGFSPALPLDLDALNSLDAWYPPLPTLDCMSLPEVDWPACPAPPVRVAAVDLFDFNLFDQSTL